LDVEISEIVEMWKSPASGSKMIYGSSGVVNARLGEKSDERRICQRQFLCCAALR